MRFMREDEALKTLHLFEEGTEEKGINKRALKNWVVSNFIMDLIDYMLHLFLSKVPIQQNYI